MAARYGGGGGGGNYYSPTVGYSGGPYMGMTSPPLAGGVPGGSAWQRPNGAAMRAKSPPGPSLWRGKRFGMRLFGFPSVALFLILFVFVVMNLDYLESISPINFSSARKISEKGSAVVVGSAQPDTGGDGVSLVVVCMNRHSTLQQVLKNWLQAKGIDEVILVDWNSDPPLTTVTRKVRDPRLVLVRVENEESWVLSRAFNLGMNLATKDKLLKLDCDYAIDPNFVPKHPLEASQRIFYSGDYGKARDENEVHLNGVLFIRRDDFWGIFGNHVAQTTRLLPEWSRIFTRQQPRDEDGVLANIKTHFRKPCSFSYWDWFYILPCDHLFAMVGYDERIQTYGWDDEDLYLRLNKSGLARTVANYDLVLHWPHGDTARAQKGVSFPQVEVDVNRLLLDNLSPWSKGTGTDCSQYTVADTRPGFLKLEAKSTPLSLQKREPADKVAEAYKLALARRLHDEYGIPWDVLSDMESPTREQMLGDFISLSGKTGVGDVIRAKALVLHTVGKPLQRMVTILFGYALAKASNRALLVIWDQEGIEAKFTDVFDSFAAVIPIMRTAYPFENAAQWDAKWGEFTGVDMTLGKDEQQRLAHADPKMTLYIKAQRFSYPIVKRDFDPAPLSVEVQKMSLALGAEGMVGVVAASPGDLAALTTAINDERSKHPGAKLFVVSTNTAVLSAIAKNYDPGTVKNGVSASACSKPMSKECAQAVAADAGALAATEVVVARKGNDFALAANGLHGVALRWV